MLQSKKDQIKKTLLETKSRRKDLDCRTVSCKFDSSHFNLKTKEYFKQIFLEAKWFYNFLLSQETIKNFDTKIKKVTIKTKDGEETRELKFLSSQMKQGILQRAIDNCVGLKESKSRGRRIGKLKFKTIVNSIPLKQNKVTFRVVSKNHVELQKCKQTLRIQGLKQTKDFEEISNATLVRRPSGLYLRVTGYRKPKERINLGSLGIDMGIKDNLTFSNGIQVNLKIPISNSIKLKQKRISKTIKGSRNRWKVRIRFQRANEKRNNQKKDSVNKLISYLKRFEIAIQDEMIKQWQSGQFGKTISESAMGEIKSELKKDSHTLVVPRSFPSTKLCPMCGSLNSIPLSQRIYKCDCGYGKHRDLHSATNILMERKNFKPVENEISVEMLKYFQTIPNMSVSFIQ
jgi:putative transposase